METGLTYTSKTVVNEQNTAIALGSGDMPVFATPAMMAVKEHLPEGSTTVGGHIESSHVKPSPLGAEVEATATLDKIDGRKLYFTIVARQGEDVIGEGKHLRFIVDRERFLSKL